MKHPISCGGELKENLMLLAAILEESPETDAIHKILTDLDSRSPL